MNGATQILAAAGGGPPTAVPRGQVFRRDGEYWTIAYDGVVIRLRDARGLHYQAHLLSHPAKRFAVTELIAAATESRESDTERARSAVSKRIRATISRIGHYHPALAQHLNRCIQTGQSCVYDPDPSATAWLVETN